MAPTNRSDLARSSRARDVVRGGNLGILVLTVLIAAFGVLMVYSASNYTAQQQTGDRFFYMKNRSRDSSSAPRRWRAPRCFRMSG